MAHGHSRNYTTLTDATRVLEGELRLIILDPPSEGILTPDKPGLVLPKQPHFVTATGTMKMQVDFYDQPPF